jgi:hypothetical protein
VFKKALKSDGLREYQKAGRAGHRIALSKEGGQGITKIMASKCDSYIGSR